MPELRPDLLTPVRMVVWVSERMSGTPVAIVVIQAIELRGAMPGTPEDNVMVTSPQADYDSLRYASPETPCPYLAGRLFRSEAYQVERLAPAALEWLMARGFRRSGRLVYRPRCRRCRECVPLRVPVDTFVHTRSMRRVWARNCDVRVEGTAAVEGGLKTGATPEKFALYRAYLDGQHDDTMERTFESFRAFLYDSPTDSFEFSYFLGRRLVGVSLVDRCPGGLSSVYMYFDPKRGGRSPGTFSILSEIEYCRREGLPYYYLGYYVTGSKTMAYKARFRPNEVLDGNGSWVPFRE